MPMESDPQKGSDWLKRYALPTKNPYFPEFQRLYRFFRASQYWPRNEIREFQFGLLKKQYALARQHVPLYRRLYADFPAELDSWDTFHKLPILTRADMNAAGDERKCEQLPYGIKPIGSAFTSGSTGHVLEVVATTASDMVRAAIGAREMAWLDLDPSCDAFFCRAIIKPNQPNAESLRKGVMIPEWSPGPVEKLYRCGKGYYIDVSTSTRQIALFLHHTAPGFLLGNPSALAEAARMLPADSRARKSVKKIRCIGETLTQDDLETFQSVFDAELQDHYSSAEVNVIATTAPDGDGYLVHDENVYLEVVRQDGTPREIGEEGRIVVTNLQPYATPFLRYDIADLGAIGEPRGEYGLTRLNKLVGRRMELIRTESGESIHLSTIFLLLHRVEGIRGVVIRQKSFFEFELVVTQLPDSPPGIEARVAEVFRKAIPFLVEVNVVLTDDLPRASSGKLQKFQWVGD